MASNRTKILTKMNFANEGALIITGVQAVGFIKPLVPVDSGYLRSSITFATNTEQAKPTAELGEKGKNVGKAVRALLQDCVEQPEAGHVVIGTNVEYAEHVEFGTVKHPAPRSFLRAGIYPNKQILGRTYSRAFKALVG